MEGSSECAEGGWGGGYSHISSPGKTKLTHVCPEHPNMSLTCPYHVPNMSLICPMYQKHRWCSDYIGHIRDMYIGHIRDMLGHIRDM
jgi:hypothetical protein